MFLSFEKVGALDAGVSQTSPPWPEISPVPWASAGAGFCRGGRCFPAEDAEQRKAAFAPGARDPNATVGQYEGKSEAEIQAELDKVVQEGMFNISINPDIRMTSGRAEAELRVENIPANHHLMSVTLSRDDTGEVLYASGLIEPGYHIQAVPLETVLPGGSYTATALFTAYDLETEQPAGQAAARVRITVAK